MAARPIAISARQADSKTVLGVSSQPLPENAPRPQLVQIGQIQRGGGGAFIVAPWLAGAMWRLRSSIDGVARRGLATHATSWVPIVPLWGPKEA